MKKNMMVVAVIVAVLLNAISMEAGVQSAARERQKQIANAAAASTCIPPEVFRAATNYAIKKYGTGKRVGVMESWTATIKGFRSEYDSEWKEGGSYLRILLRWNGTAEISTFRGKRLLESLSWTQWRR